MIHPVSADRASSAAAVVGKAAVRTARLLGLSNAALAGVLGLSEATTSQLASGTYKLVPGSKPYELALLLVQLSRGLDAMVGGEEEPMRAWMHTPNLALAGVPAERVRSVTGLMETVSHVDGARVRF